MVEKTEDINRKKILMAYQRMEILPKQLYRLVCIYSNDIKNEIERHDKRIQEIEREFREKKLLIESKRWNAKKEAEAARDTIFSQLNELKEKEMQAKEVYKNAVELLPRARFGSYLAIGNDLIQVLQMVKEKEEKTDEAFLQAYENVKAQEYKAYDEKVKDAEELYEIQIEAAVKENSEDLNEENKKTKENTENIYNTLKKDVELLEPAELREMYEMLQITVAPVANYTIATKMPVAIEVGYLDVDLDEWRILPHADQAIELVCDYFSFALKNKNGRTKLQIPYGRSFEDINFNKMIKYDMAGREFALEYLRALEMRFFMSIPCGKLRTTMIDPENLGSTFSMFSILGEADERIISTRIWSDPQRIKEQLDLLIGQIEHVNQDCLRNDFDNIVVYNEHIGKNAEPLQMLFVADFPKHFDQDACTKLEKIVNSGPKCGIYTFIAGSKADMEECKFNLSGIMQATEQVTFVGGNLSYDYDNMKYIVEPIKLPEKSDQDNIFKLLVNGIRNSERIIITFDEVSDGLTKNPEKWFEFYDENGLDVPIGLEGARRTVQVHLGGESITQHHALISGTIGAGKSTLLHTIIMSILLRYSPEDVQIYLLDFKRGVESKVYAECKLPNFRVISLDTEPEFGLAVLKQLDAEQAARAQEFHDKLCENIEKYNELAEKDLNDDIYKLPRIVLLIDEFHEMFANPESEVSKECERLLEQIVRQGRALGVHVILASQTLPDNLVKIYGQIMNRIALQSTAASAQYILDSDNEAVKTLVSVDSGKGIFNDGGGNRDANHPFRVAYFLKDEQRELLKQIKNKQKEKFRYLATEKPRLLLSTIQDDNDNPINQFVKEGVLPKVMTFGCPLYLGEEIAMENEFGINLGLRKAQNLLIMGSDHKRASLLYGFSAISILFNEFRRSPDGKLPDEPIITYFDFAKTPSYNSRLARGNFDIMNELCAQFPHSIRVFGKDSLLDGIETLQREYEKGISQRRHYVIFAGLNRARRLLDNSSAYSISPKQVFVNLVKNGPEAGYNYIVWANEPTSFMSFYSDILHEFDYRLVYNLTEEEYKAVIMSTSVSANLGNQNVLSYNPDEDNKMVRIYSMPLLGWFDQFVNRLKGNKVVNQFEDGFWEEPEFEF